MSSILPYSLYILKERLLMGVFRYLDPILERLWPGDVGVFPHRNPEERLALRFDPLAVDESCCGGRRAPGAPDRSPETLTAA